MSVVIGTLCLNEMQWLPKLYEQHKDWPKLVKWVFVESADRMYKKANPDLVNKHGLSVDGTSEFLSDLSKSDDRVVYVPHGFSSHSNPALGKCESRQKYLDIANNEKPSYIVTMDADEFYTKQHQNDIDRLMGSMPDTIGGVTIHYRNIWSPPCNTDGLFSWEITGKLWKVLVCKVWKWRPNLQYRNNHNSPSVNGYLLNRRLLRLENKPKTPQFIHMGFASDPTYRSAKNSYYEERGEGKQDDIYRKYVTSRSMFSYWKRGMYTLPNGDMVIPYNGPIPEVFNV